MTNSKELYNDLVKRITLDEEKVEIQSIAYLLLEKLLGLTRTHILAKKNIDDINSSFFDSYVKRINAHEPIQYILSEAFFYGRSFKVNPVVLIPRPETELLVREIISHVQKQKVDSLRILDIGTGSGCIAISLALEIARAEIVAIDISKEALICAKQNAHSLGAEVSFEHVDILQEDIANTFDIIVSNPPYISQAEKSSMRKNVLDYEPHLALFADGNDPLIFYRTIARKARKALIPGGSLWFEINEHYSKEIFTIINECGFQKIKTHKDLDNKDRMISGYRFKDLLD